MEYRATFIDEVEFRAAPTDNARHGRFPRDQSLRDFLRSGPAVAATIKILWGFMSEKSGDMRVDLIEAYVLRGGDKGLAWASMRLACGLPPRPLPGAPPATEGAAVKSELVPAPVDAVEVRSPFSIVGEARLRLATLAFELAEHMLEELDVVTYDHIKRRWTATGAWATEARRATGRARERRLVLAHRETRPQERRLLHAGVRDGGRLRHHRSLDARVAWKDLP